MNGWGLMEMACMYVYQDLDAKPSTMTQEKSKTAMISPWYNSAMSTADSAVSDGEVTACSGLTTVSDHRVRVPSTYRHGSTSSPEDGDRKRDVGWIRRSVAEVHSNTKVGMLSRAQPTSFHLDQKITDECTECLRMESGKFDPAPRDQAGVRFC